MQYIVIKAFTHLVGCRHPRLHPIHRPCTARARPSHSPPAVDLPHLPPPRCCCFLQG